MTFPVELISAFENCITDSVVDSIGGIEKQFFLAQTRYGWSAAIQCLAMAYITAENRRRFVESELHLRPENIENT
ncbi:TPA: hypothetical protein QIF36_002379 [Enterobacter kobei]|nr:hypothetical protein [Enterobacter kobei]